MPTHPPPMSAAFLGPFAPGVIDNPSWAGVDRIYLPKLPISITNRAPEWAVLLSSFLLQSRHWRIREVKARIRSHTARRTQSWDLNSGSLPLGHRLHSCTGTTLKPRLRSWLEAACPPSVGVGGGAVRTGNRTGPPNSSPPEDSGTGR